MKRPLINRDRIAIAFLLTALLGPGVYVRLMENYLMRYEYLSVRDRHLLVVEQRNRAALEPEIDRQKMQAAILATELTACRKDYPEPRELPAMRQQTIDPGKSGKTKVL